MKAILLVVLGAVSYHLYANASDREQLVYKARSGVTAAADLVADTARPDLVDQLRNR